MASDVQIANRALTKLGARRILSLADDVKEARAINSMFEIVRDSELRAHPWNFAMTRASLPALVSTPAWGFARQFQLPADCLRVIQINEEYWVANLTDYRTRLDVPFQIEGGKVLTDFDAPLKIRYVARIADTQAWDTCFVEAFASKLAYETCEEITQSNTKKQEMWNDYNMMIRQAKRMDAIENPPEPFADTSWLLSRIP